METLTFEHPRFGKFESDDGGERWKGRVVLAGFGRYGWREELDIFFYRNEKGPPEARGFELLEPVVANGSGLPDLIVDALWKEVSGEEPENDIWWSRRGGLEEVNEGLDEPITKRDDLWRVLDPYSLFVRTDRRGDKELVAGVHFACEFEQEHGLDVLTDGRRVLGTGYALDAEKYARFSRRKK